MRVSYHWLNDYVESGLELERLAELLTHQAVPVEAIEPVGEGDHCLELEVTYNRPDLLSHIGVAREVAAGTGAPVRVPDVTLPEDEAAAGLPPIAVHIEAPHDGPIYTARRIEGVRIGPSPDWLRARLEAVGLRSINNVVDVTNFVMYECGQPLHAFDLDRLAGPEIRVRHAREGETIRLLDGSERTLCARTLVIADAERPVAIAGVMGGADSEIDEHTANVLLESAYFDPVAIRAAVRRLKLTSDSSYRFERGADPAMVSWASRRAAALILEVAGGRLVGPEVRAEGVLERVPRPRTLRLRLGRLASIAGHEISRKQAARILSRLGFEVIEQEQALEVRVPSARHEVAREIDLIEEVMRVDGYDRVPIRDTITVRAVRSDRRTEVLRRVREVMVAAGLREIQSVSFAPADDRADPPLFAGAPPLRLRNPVRADLPVLRRSLFAGLCEAKRLNFERGNRCVRLFETANVYLPRPEAQPDERLQLGLLIDGDFFDAKGVVEALARALRLERLRFVPHAGELPGFDRLERAQLRLGDTPIGWLGRVGADSLRWFDIDGEPPVVALLDLEPVIEAAVLTRTYVPPSAYPALTRDIAIVVEERVYVGDLIEAVREAAPPVLRSVALLSVFAGDGKSVARGKKSVALRLVLQSEERTLTGPEADRAREAIKAALVERFAASFRE